MLLLLFVKIDGDSFYWKYRVVFLELRNDSKISTTITTHYIILYIIVYCIVFILVMTVVTLLEASYCGDIETVERIISSGNDLTERDEVSCVPIEMKTQSSK